MSHQVFVPVTDDIMYNHPELIEGPLVPYTAGMECHEWLAIEINPEDELPKNQSNVSRKVIADKSKADLYLAYSVV